ncbi:JAB domain-containing protein [Brevundimonas sp.]|uniref:JAB domain-containing protein n=1 Tax=Brevundimonas sp. TaxID=1871086 RepID=UPI003F6EBC52
MSLALIAAPTSGRLSQAHRADADGGGCAWLRRLLTDLDLADGDPLGAALQRRFDTVGAFLHAEPAELRRQGLDQAAIDKVKRLAELTEHLARETASRQPVITSWSSLVAYARVTLAHRPREQFRVLYLDKKNRLLCDEAAADGSVDHAPVYPREVVRRALEAGASALILLHNHPSGDPQPSQADIAMTRKVVEAARVFDIPVHDHLVVGRAGTASFRAMGLLP